MIGVLGNFDSLTATEKNGIRIITQENLDSLIHAESSVTKGVQTALRYAKKGIAVESILDVRPGDFVQFWNVFQGNAYGHCGIVLDIDPKRSITLYSSHPLTDGYGKQQYLWPDKLYFVRLK